jgi:hypothetical protein
MDNSESLTILGTRETNQKTQHNTEKRLSILVNLTFFPCSKNVINSDEISFIKF